MSLHGGEEVHSLDKRRRDGEELNSQYNHYPVPADIVESMIAIDEEAWPQQDNFHNNCVLKNRMSPLFDVIEHLIASIIH